LIRRGWTKNSLPAGTAVNAQGFQVRGRSFRASWIGVARWSRISSIVSLSLERNTPKNDGRFRENRLSQRTDIHP
jgi:hypothetical protein